MFAEVSTIRARFTMRLRCHNCHHMTKRQIESPDLEDAPCTVEELLESASFVSGVESAWSNGAQYSVVWQCGPGFLLRGCGPDRCFLGGWMLDLGCLCWLVHPRRGRWYGGECEFGGLAAGVGEAAGQRKG